MSQASNTVYGDIIASKTLNDMKRALEQRAYVMSKITNVSQFATKGNAVIHVPFVTTESGQVKSVGEAFDAPSGDGTGSKDLPLNKKAGNPFLIKRDTAYQTMVNMLNAKSQDSAEHILEKMDVEVVKGIIGAVPSGNIVDFAGSATTADKITAADFIAARKALSVANAPISGRTCFISPDHESQLLEIDNFISADKLGNMSKMPMIEGFIGRAYGFDIVVINHLPKVDKAGAINATAAKNDSYPVLFVQKLGYMWGKQLVETNHSLQDLANADRYVPYNVFGNATLEANYLYMVCDKKTADPTE